MYDVHQEKNAKLILIVLFNVINEYKIQSGPCGAHPIFVEKCKENLSYPLLKLCY